MPNQDELQFDVLGTKVEPLVRLDGQLLGDTQLPIPLPADLISVTLDLAGLGKINSMGVRQWDRWMFSIRKANTRALIRLVHVPSFFIDLFNVIHEFVPRPYAVESFCVPYYCEQCDHSLDFLIERDRAGKLPKNLGGLPEVHCDRCNIPMQVDLESDRCFSFLERAEKTA